MLGLIKTIVWDFGQPPASTSRECKSMCQLAAEMSWEVWCKLTHHRGDVNPVAKVPVVPSSQALQFMDNPQSSLGHSETIEVDSGQPPAMSQAV